VRLIGKMSQANVTWGAPRIRNELGKLGIDVAVSTVAQYILRHRKPPSPTWRAFPDYDLKDLVALDFFVVPTVTFGVLFGLVVLAHHPRCVLHFDVTANPTADWTARQVIQAFPEETALRFLVRDRDKIYGERYRRTVEVLGIEEVVTTARSPWQNRYAERLIGSLRRDYLDHIIVLDEVHFQRNPGAVLQVLQQDPLPLVPGRGCPGAAGRAGTGVRRGGRAPRGGWSPPSTPAGSRMTGGSGSRGGPFGPAIRANGVFGNDSRGRRPRRGLTRRCTTLRSPRVAYPLTVHPASVRRVGYD
jgi:putative transposase